MKIVSIDEVRDLVVGAENGRVEFKETTGQLERAMETLCAFLNGVGGTVVFGVTDKGKIKGQEVSDSTKRNIAEAVNRLEPTATVQISYVPLKDGERQVIVLHAEEARFDRPFCYKGRPYMRVESVTTTMPQSVYNDLLLQREEGNPGWESFVDEKLRLSDLDEAEILRTVRLGIECGRLPETIDNKIPVILERLGLSENGKLKHAAVVLFSSRPNLNYPQCLLRLARFRGTDKRVFIDNQRVRGNVFQLLDAAMAFVFKHLSLSGTTDKLEREEHLSIPYRAIREAVINALCHRSYRDPGGSVGMAIYDNRVEIENPGSFPAGWDMERIKKEHASKPNNPLIADTLYVRKILESWGRGINLMMEECEKANLPEPEYRIHTDEVKLIFYYQPEPAAGETALLPYKYHINTLQLNDSVSDVYPLVSPRFPHGYPTVTPQLPHSYPTVTSRIENVLLTIGNNEMSAKEIMEHLALRDKTSFLESYLYPAIKADFVEALYPNQPKHPRQKYRLTAKGLEVVEGR
ncbi:MAG: putative DNA binding domain-containing protein [Bacteroides sp.]|nr:putative DNA binding domain-containing protein [Bacteroides sp.]MCM1085765.1 putative DNA binding domain-containing protein [Bacteroides sp.]